MYPNPQDVVPLPAHPDLAQYGAQVDAFADMYGGNATTLGLVATSIYPLRAGVQNALIDLLLDRGALIVPSCSIAPAFSSLLIS